MKNKIVLGLFLVIQVIFGVHLQGQSWRTELGFPSTDERGVAVTTTFDSAYVAAGVVDYGSALQMIYVCKLDDLGDTIWTKTYPNLFSRSYLQPSDIIQLSDSGFAISLTFVDPGFIHFYLIAKIDKEGVLLWTKAHVNPSCGEGAMILGLAEASNGDICMTGLTSNYNQSSNSSFSVLRIDSQGDTLWEWVNVLGQSIEVDGYDVLVDHNDDVVAVGEYPYTSPARISPFIAKIDAQGSTIWTYSPDSTLYPWGKFENVAQLPDSDYVVAGIIGNPSSSSKTVLVEKVDRQGNVVWSKSWGMGNWVSAGIACQGLKVDAQGNIYLLWNNPSMPVAANLWKLDVQGNLMWGMPVNGIQLDETTHDHFSLTPDNQFVFAGYSDLTGQMVVMKLDSSGPHYRAHHFIGNVFADINANCLQEPGDSGLAALPVIVKHVGSGIEYHGMTDAGGHYAFMVTDTGQYTVQVDTSWAFAGYFPSAACAPAAYTILVTSVADTFIRDFPRAVSLEAVCPVLQVDIMTDALRRCEGGPIYIQYKNYGLETVTKPRIEVDIDNAYSPIGSIPAWDSQLSSGNHLVFLVDTLTFLDAGSIRIHTFLDPGCNATVLGQTVCMEAHIYPDSACVPDSIGWDGSSLIVKAICQGDTSVQLKVKNVGANAMLAPGNVIIVEDNILRLSTQIQLNSGDSAVFNYPANGSTWYIEAEQSAGHPGISEPSAFVEGCGTNLQGSFSRGFGVNYPQDDANLAVSVHCGQVIGSHDPNMKEVFPPGVGPDHLISANQKMEYVIHFQNTGNAPAYRVVVIDTLPSELLPGSIQLGASSHPYTFYMNLSGTATWIFDPINLPDSATNEDASKGQFKFSIDQVPGLSPGTKIKNAVDIYFDFNAPISTDTAWSTIAAPEELLIARFDPAQDEAQKITVYPNPFSGVSHIDLGEYYKAVKLEVFDLQGRLIYQSYQPYARTMDFSADGLGEGVYIYRVTSNSEILGSGRLLLQR